MTAEVCKHFLTGGDFSRVFKYVEFGTFSIFLAHFYPWNESGIGFVDMTHCQALYGNMDGGFINLQDNVLGRFFGYPGIICQNAVIKHINFI